MDPFIKPLDTYVRNYNLYETYIEDASLFLSKMENISLDEARAFVLKTTAPDGQHPIKVPMARFLERNSQGDRVRKQLPLDQLWNVIRQDRQIFAPNMTAYVHPDICKSILATYISGNLKRRNNAKQAQFAAERAGNMREWAIWNSAQTTFKIKNNALSGAHSSPYTILWNKSSHSTLTSGCRTATSYGNASNEKFLYGNRHYWSPTITKNNLVSICTHTHIDDVKAAIETFGLVIPTIEDVMGMVWRSTESYWRDPTCMAGIHTLVSTFTDYERAAVMYTGDFYHLAQLNPDVVKTLLLELATRSETSLSPAEVEESKSLTTDELLSFVSMLCPDYLMNPDTGRYEALKDVKRPREQGMLYGNIRRVVAFQDKYALLIRTFWVTDNIPSSIYYLPNIIRRGVITSDTDSTIFSVSYWPKWVLGHSAKTPQANAIAASMVYLSAKVIGHILARFTANCGVAKQDIFRLQMKNEFFMPVFALTTRAKHYYANVTMQEGTTKLHPEIDIKGVALRSSSVPPEVMRQSKAMIKAIIDKVMAGEKISLRSVLRRVALIEDGIKRSIIEGQFRYLKRGSIMSLDSYKDPEKNNYIHYELWEAVFARKYGPAPEVPYRVVKVSIDTDRPARLQQWMDSMEDRAIAQNLADFLKEKDKKAITTLLLPEINLIENGIPKEIIPRIDERNLISQTMESFYLILETLGYFIKDRHLARLVSDDAWLLDPANPIEPFKID